ncbi:MAG: tRNA uridine-5-carboxymethylaminomethyl(34) synthesis GTPase MnmE [Bacteroidetes bacterium]|nr:tRNA uridine-5-carboxymethylaminomethyl(34) synthesis GTPase MnmE [Bacteroidota bacterium]MBU1579926.1 tRNA uridine-5-carboxymethylaminomethyl(34) synthesis GTPase MnmE [Bacteroidota bacterium]MBU2556602.1 tRNA uridine-5-carboxymethylaminomethyl(34) synthesis GTPase MnmE [Bacteroidota bacterium]
MYIDLQNDDTICALASPAGMGAIAVIRVSGKASHSIANQIFKAAKKTFVMDQSESHKAYFGQIVDSVGFVDEVLLTVFRAPHSYTGEDAVEISCHGSVYIQQRMLKLLLSKGARLAEPGEFTMRAFGNGHFDLAQAEAVADLIASQSKAAHSLAVNQMRGGFSERIKDLRTQLIDFTALIELELDFSEEDVEFANRDKFKELLQQLRKEISRLMESFQTGNAIKNGIPVAIIGKPNVGKSTLLNAILNEEKAIVSDIPGTTRDTIEDTIILDGQAFRFIDTAGLRQSEDVIENLGIERTYDKIQKATVILYLCDLTACDNDSADEMIHEFRDFIQDENKHFILIGNKADLLLETPAHFSEMVALETIFISAKRKENINLIIDSLLQIAQRLDTNQDTIVSNVRHYNALHQALVSLDAVEESFAQNLPTDLVAIDLRAALHHLGTITGQISNDEILGSIFSKFCIGK